MICSHPKTNNKSAKEKYLSRFFIGSELEAVGYRWNDWKKAHLLQNPHICLRIVVEVQEEWVAAAVSIVNRKRPSAFEFLVFFVEVGAHIHSVIRPQAITVAV